VLAVDEWAGLLHLVQRGGAWRAAAPPSPLIAIPNVTAHPSMASVPIAVLLYDGPLLCGFSMAIKGLICEMLAAKSVCVSVALARQLHQYQQQ